MIFLDSSMFVAYWNIRDVHHERADKLMKKILNNEYGPAFFSDYIFDEVVTVLLFKVGFKIANEIGEYLLNSELEMVAVDNNLFSKSWALFNTSRDQSFTDCTILAVMEEYGIEKLATFDKGFAAKVDVVDG